MENFNTVPDRGTFGGSVEVINQNFLLAQQEMETLRQAYNSLSHSKAIPVTQLPATGEAGKIYRLAGTTSYADYMYSENDLTTPIKMAEYDNAIDDKPTPGSNNLTTSGGVCKAIQDNGKLLYKGFWILKNHIVSHNSGTDHPLIENNNWDVIVIAIPDNAISFYVTGVNVNSHDIFPSDNLSLWVGNYFLGTNVNNLTNYPTAKYISVNLEHAENAEAIAEDYANIQPVWTYKQRAINEAVENSNEPISSGAIYGYLPKTFQEIVGTKKQGYIPSSGVIQISSDYVHYVFNVEVGEKYHIHVPSFPQYSVLPAVWYITRFTSSGNYDVVAVEGGVIEDSTTVLDFDVTIPQGTLAIGITSRESATGAPSVTTIGAVTDVETYTEKYVGEQFTKLKKSGKGLMVVKNGTDIYIRTKYDESIDLVQKYVQDDNNCMKPDRTWMGGNALSNKGLCVDANLLHIWSDSNGPIYNSSYSPWHLFSNHGYRVPCMRTSNSSLTVEDEGSVWKDQLNREFTIGKVESSFIVLLPKIYLTEIPGLYTRSWEQNQDLPTILTHVSGAVHTGQVALNGAYISNYQIKPIQQSYDRTFLCDGKPITEDGEYYCDDFSINELLVGLNPTTTQVWFPTPIRESQMIELLYSYNFHGLSTRFDVTINVKYPIHCGFFGANQAQHTEAKDGYDIYVFAPRSKYQVAGHATDVPFKNNPSDSSSRSITCNRNTVDCYDIDKMPDRLVSYLQRSSDGHKLIGFASGLSLTRGVTIDSERKNYIPEGSLCFNDSISQSNKMYIVAISSDKYENNLLPTTLCKTISSYFSYYKPSSVGEVYYYKDGNEYVVYAHVHTSITNSDIVLPQEMEGLSVEIVDKTDGIELHTDIVVNGRIYISSNSAPNNYLVLKLK